MESILKSNWYLWIILFLLIGWLYSRMCGYKTDMKWDKLDSNLPWDSEPDKSLDKIYDYVIAFSDSTILWYQSRRQPKRYWGVSLRVGALLATAAAGLIPLSDKLGMGVIPSVWSTVLVVAAGVFVSIDVLGGFTSGWVRYMLTQQKVERLRDTFLFEWNVLKVEQTNMKDMLERAKAFILAVSKVIDDETQEWATEFQNAIKEMEKARKIAADIENTGAIEVSVKNPQAVIGGWTLEIDGNQRGKALGKSLAVTDVLVGIRKLKVYGQDAQDKTFSDEKTLKVIGGVTVTKEFELN